MRRASCARRASEPDSNRGAGTSIGAKAYLVLCRNARALARIFPTVKCVGNYTGKLSSSGELLQVRAVFRLFARFFP